MTRCGYSEHASNTGADLGRFGRAEPPGPARPAPADPGRTVTFCNGIAFPSTYDHRALRPRQLRSAPSGRTMHCSDTKNELLFESTSQQGPAQRGPAQDPPQLRLARAGPARPGPGPSPG